MPKTTSSASARGVDADRDKGERSREIQRDGGTSNDHSTHHGAASARGVVEGIGASAIPSKPVLRCVNVKLGVGAPRMRDVGGFVRRGAGKAVPRQRGYSTDATATPRHCAKARSVLRVTRRTRASASKSADQ